MHISLLLDKEKVKQDLKDMTQLRINCFTRCFSVFVSFCVDTLIEKTPCHHWDETISCRLNTSLPPLLVSHDESLSKFGESMQEYLAQNNIWKEIDDEVLMLALSQQKPQEETTYSFLESPRAPSNNSVVNTVIFNERWTQRPQLNVFNFPCQDYCCSQRFLLFFLTFWSWADCTDLYFII